MGACPRTLREWGCRQITSRVWARVRERVLCLQITRILWVVASACGYVHIGHRKCVDKSPLYKRASVYTGFY